MPGTEIAHRESKRFGGAIVQRLSRQESLLLRF